MRREAAFQFIPELIGDFSHAMELSANPKLLYVEAAISTIHMAADVYTAFEEYNNTKRKKETEKALKEKYDELDNKKNSNYEIEALKRLELEYEKVRLKLRNEQFQDAQVREFIRYLQKDLKKACDFWGSIQLDPDYPERAKVEEITRKTIRDYNKLISIF